MFEILKNVVFVVSILMNIAFVGFIFCAYKSGSKWMNENNENLKENEKAFRMLSHDIVRLESKFDAFQERYIKDTEMDNKNMCYFCDKLDKLEKSLNQIESKYID